MREKWLCLLCGFFLAGANAWAQSEGDVIINEIGNSGTAKNTYAGGDYVELLVLKTGGLNLSGWYLTDLSSLTGTPKATEGSIRFSDAEGSVFRQSIPQGTYILVWLSSKDSVADVAKHEEDVSLVDGNNRIEVFACHSSKHIDRQEGYINLTGKDNLALLKSWNRDAAMDVLVWGGTSRWTGCVPTDLPVEVLTNGAVAGFVPRGKTVPDFKENSDPVCWNNSTDASNATPGRTNKGVDDSILIPKKE